MDIAIIADDLKKELMCQFCIAYCGILSKHRICATATTGKYIATQTGLKIECVLPGFHGGVQQLLSRIAYNEIDMLIYFRDYQQTDPRIIDTDQNLLKTCDKHDVPFATNLATPEILINALDRGDIDWRNLLNPRSEVNRSRRFQVK